ncbi:MAG: DegV family protein [Dehalococcoidia bacterium]
MSDVTIVTDASADLPAEVAEGLGVLVAPIGYEVGGRHLLNTDQTPGQLYDAIEASGPAQVSGVSAEAFEGAFRAAAQRTKHIICICQSIGSSHTRVSAEVAARNATADTGVAVKIVSPGRGGPGLAAIVLAAARCLADAGPGEALAVVERLSGAADALIVAGGLEQLERAGQLALLRAQSTHGSLDDGVSVFRVRGNLSVWGVHPDAEAAERAVVARAEELSGGRAAYAVVTHALAPAAAERLAAAVRARLEVREVIITQIGPALACLLGRGSYGLGVCAASEG